MQDTSVVGGRSGRRPPRVSGRRRQSKCAKQQQPHENSPVLERRCSCDLDLGLVELAFEAALGFAGCATAMFADDGFNGSSCRLGGCVAICISLSSLSFPLFSNTWELSALGGRVGAESLFLERELESKGSWTKGGGVSRRRDLGRTVRRAGGAKGVGRGVCSTGVAARCYSALTGQTTRYQGSRAD